MCHEKVSFQSHHAGQAVGVLSLSLVCINVGVCNLRSQGVLRLPSWIFANLETYLPAAELGPGVRSKGFLFPWKLYQHKMPSNLFWISQLHKCSSVSEDKITCTVVICHPFQGETMATEGSLLWISPSGSIWIKSFSNVGVLCLQNTKHNKSFTSFCALGFSRFGHMPIRAIQVHPKQMGWEGERDGLSMQTMLMPSGSGDVGGQADWCTEAVRKQDGLVSQLMPQSLPGIRCYPKSVAGYLSSRYPSQSDCGQSPELPKIQSQMSHDPGS